MQIQKISILPHTEGTGIVGGLGTSVRAKNLNKCIKFNPNFKTVWGGGGGGGGLLLGRYDDYV